MAALEKVKKHPRFIERADQVQNTIAEELTSHEQIKEYFRPLLNMKDMEDNIREIDRYSPTHSLEVRNQKEQLKHETARACYLPVQLFLSKLGRQPPRIVKHFTPLLRFAFGPLHAGLIIGNVVVEWDDGSLVVPTEEVVPPDVCTYVTAEGEWRDTVEDAVGRMSMAHRQNLDVPHKLEILYQSKVEKERLIDQLVRVIVDYNTQRQYSIFRCNCQDFVKDALQALGIQKLPEFEGNLKAYVESLQGGKPKMMKFASHAELDNYVELNREGLDTQEKEYCVCIYFEFHAKETAELTPEQQEEWQCPEHGCLCCDLEEEIVNDSLHFYKYQRQQQRKVEAKKHPRMAGIREEPVVRRSGAEARLREEEDPFALAAAAEFEDSLADAARQFLHPDESLDDQAAYLKKCTGYSDKIKAKLHRHPTFAEVTKAEIESVSEILGEKEPFRQRYFSNLIEITSMKSISEVDHDQSYASRLSKKELRQRSKLRFDRLLDMKMHLLLRASSQRTFWKMLGIGSTPLHCALQVGDFVFEWNESSLVIPVDVSCAHDEPILFSPVQDQSEWCAKIQSDSTDIRKSIEQNDYKMQIGLHFKWTEEKEHLISAFIDTVIDFNRHHTYHHQSCNSQRFVSEGMRALGIRQPPKLSSTIKEHVNELTKSTTLSVKRVSSHVDLDATVASQLGALSREDVEFLMAHYLQFHMDSYERNKQVSQGWVCPVVGCKLKDLEELLEKFSSPSSQ